MSKAAEYFRMLAEIYSDLDRWVRDPNGTDNSDVIAWCSQAADCMDLIEWAHEVGAKIQPWGSQWRAEAGAHPFEIAAAAGHSRVDMSLHYAVAGKDREVAVVEKIRRRVQ